MMGAQDPEDYPAICHNYMIAKTKLYDELDLGEPVFDSEVKEYAAQA